MGKKNSAKFFNQKKALELRTLFYILAALFTAGVMGFIILRAINTILK